MEFGKYIGVLIIGATGEEGLIARLKRWSLGQLPLSFDAVVFRFVGLLEHLSDGSRMAEELNRDLRWLI